MKNEILKGFCALILSVVTMLVFSTNNVSAFEVITGSVTEFAGPDDLGLDPDSTVIAVDVYGNADSAVNGVTFHTDRAGLGDAVGDEGAVTVGDVTVKTTTTHFIDNWSNGGGGPAFTGGTEGSAAALSEIMRDIRWSAAPAPISIDVSGLASGTTYKIQLLFNEGADRNRGWDIAVNDELAVDNFNSEGGDGTWTNSNSFAYSGEFTSTADGTIAVQMQNNIGGADQVAPDGNPILQGIVINTTGPAVYAQNFDGFEDGTKDLGDGSVIAGQAASIQGDRLQLTIDGQGLGFSSFSVPGLPGTQLGFTATFDYELFDSAGANDPADGFSFNFGSAALGELGSAEEGMTGKTDNNISFEVDTWRNGDAEQGVNISGLLNGSDVGQLAFTNGVILEDDSRKTGTIEISWNPAVGASFTTTGMTTNADFSNVDTGAFVADDGHNFIISARVGGANEDLFIDNLVITVDGTDDADRDGLPDYWEEKYGVDDPEGDDDEDGLTNIEELEARTKPDTADTDEDGINDGDELNVTETNPKKADSDNDGLLDGVETNTGTFVSKDDTGTDPNNADTDDDGFRDSIEVAQGSDPSDKNSLPDVPVITLLGVGTGALLQNDLTDPENDGVEGPTDPGPPQTAGTDFNWVSINASDENYFSGQGAGNEGAFDLFDNTTGGGVNKWCCAGAPQWITVEFEEPVSISHFVVAASNDSISHNRAPLDWGIYGSNDGENFEPIFEQSDDEPIWKADEEVYLFNLPRPSDPYTFIKYDVTRTNGGNHEIGELEYFGEVGAGALNEIVEINYEKDTENIELTWNSRPGKTYGIFYSLNLEDFDADVDDGIIGEEGETTSYSFENPEPGVPKIFFRVMVMDE